MGIRFFCQNCEKRLNVKSVQAGEYGQCPGCLTQIRVPAESTISARLFDARHDGRRVGESDESSIGLRSADDQITIDGIPAENFQHHAPTKPRKSHTLESPMVSGVDKISSRLFMLDKPELPATLGKVDPITQAPNQIWYFRSRELGERGPLKPSVMREHVDQGDVTVGCIVWRQDWHDWLPAERVFPKLVAEASGAVPGATPRSANPPSVDEPRNPPTVFEQRQRKKQRIFLSLIVVGILVIGVLLAVVLILIANDH